MGAVTKIQWCHHTFNHIRGCIRYSEGCRFCYSEKLAKRNSATLGTWGPESIGTRIFASEAKWREPLAWDRDAKLAGERRRVFCASLADVFEDWDGPIQDSHGRKIWISSNGEYYQGDSPSAGFRELTMDDCRDRLFNLIQATPNLDWLLLTKRPKVALRYLVEEPSKGLPREWGLGWPNVWLGVSVENQLATNRLITALSIPAAIHWASCEPLLERIELAPYFSMFKPRWFVRLDPWPFGRLDWVVCGGESGSPRPFKLHWARSLRDECRLGEAAFFMKQLGANPFDISPLPAKGELVIWQECRLKLRDSHGGNPEEWPEDLRVREFPTFVFEGEKP